MTLSSVARLVGAASFAALLAGCTSGVSLPAMPSMPSLPSLSLGADEAAQADADKPKSERVISAADLAEPGPLGDQVIGKANAPVTVVEYLSLTCANSAKFQAETLPKLKKAYIDKGKVKLVLREYPIGKAAAATAVLSRCLPQKDYFKVVEKLLSTQQTWVAQEVKPDDIYNAVKFTGIKRDKFDECLTNQSINDALVLVKQRGRGFGVSGTPTFFVNGKKLAGAVSFEEMQPVIEAALANPAASAPAAQQPQSQQHVSANPA
jgi:protein-disulfide isomerase